MNKICGPKVFYIAGMVQNCFVYVTMYTHIIIYTQVLHSYLEDDTLTVDNDTAVKLGCLELRRFYKDMPQVALKKKENFAMLE